MAKSASKQTKPKIGYFIQSRGPGGTVEFEEVYVYGPTRRSDEGIVGHDLQMRPMRLGPGDYTFVGSPDDVEWTRPASAPTKKSHAQIKREIDKVLASRSPITEVMFRAFPEGDVIALFPQDQQGAGMINSYQHMGQHGEASRRLIKELRRASPAEYAPLLTELESIGYRLRIK